MESGLLSPEQLKSILTEHSKSGLRLGQYLIRKDIFRESQIVDFVSRQLRIPKFDAEAIKPDASLNALVPMEFAQRYHIAPVNRKAGLLQVVMTNPMDITTIDHLEELTQLEVEPLICTEAEFNDVTYVLYGVQSNLSEVMEKAGEMQVSAKPDSEEADAVGDVNVSSLQDMAEEAPVIRLVNSILLQAAREGASDIHISPEKKYVQLRFRVDGKLKEVPAPPKGLFLPIVSRVKILGGMDIAASRVPQDGRFTFQIDEKEVHVRVSSLPTIYGENVVLRLLARSQGAVSLNDLGLSEPDLGKIETAIEKPWGMILSTGPTGSGKSTTLYAVLGRINKPDINIVTLEDPVETRVEKIRQVQLNRKAGMTFASGLRSILRQDPDVVMVGEIRDGETANIAVQAALTGHRLLSTLHTNDSAGAVTRLIEMGVEPFLVSSTLIVSIAQRLIRKICPSCREPYKPSADVLTAMGIEDAGQIFYRGKGCPACHNTGFMGRTGIFEILPVDDMIKDLVLKRAGAHTIMRAAIKEGKLVTLREDAARKAKLGITTLEEAAGAVLM